MKGVKQFVSPELNFDGVQLFMVALWDPPPSDGPNPFVGVGEGVDYGDVDRDWDKIISPEGDTQ